MKAIIGIGIPGSGKTTYFKKLAHDTNSTYISSDDFRAALLGNAADQSKNQQVWHAVYNKIAESLSRNNIIIDATNAKAHERCALVDFCRKHGATAVIGYYFDIPPEVAIARNKVRHRFVPEEAIYKMHQLLMQDPPSLEDGFTEIIKVP